MRARWIGSVGKAETRRDGTGRDGAGRGGAGRAGPFALTTRNQGLNFILSVMG